MHTPPLRPEHIVVIVEDNEAISTLLADVFHLDLGARVLVAGSGEQLKTIVSDVVPHLIVLDVRLPGISGIDCAHWLREYEPTRAVPLIGMSAQENRAPMLAAGCGDFIAKPFDINKVIDLVGRVLDAGRHTDV